MVVSLEPATGERIIRTVRATRLTPLPVGYGGFGGTLQLTDHRILFTPNRWVRFNSWLSSRLRLSPSMPESQPLEILLEDVSGVDSGSISFVPNHIVTIETAARTFRFMVRLISVADLVSIIRRHVSEIREAHR